MKKTAQQASTQAFTEIADIRDDIVLLQGGNACIILSVTSVNFSLLAGEEQDSKVFAYAALLNSLSFPIQILVRSKPIEIMPYIEAIDERIQKEQNSKLKTYMTNYKDFVTSLVQTTTVLDKQFYVVISYSPLEAGAASVIKGQSSADSFEQAQTSLETKAESLLAQIHRLSLQAHVLKKDALVKLFYDIYNQGESFPIATQDIDHALVKGRKIATRQ